MDTRSRQLATALYNWCFGISHHLVYWIYTQNHIRDMESVNSVVGCELLILIALLAVVPPNDFSKCIPCPLGARCDGSNLVGLVKVRVVHVHRYTLIFLT
jgi:hypothetical protein